MSIAVGLRDMTGTIVLCADRQMTKEGGLKFQGTKILWRQRGVALQKDFFNVVFAYCGHPEVAANLFEASVDAIGQATADESACHFDDFFKHALEPVFRARDSKRIEALIGVQSSQECVLLRTNANQVVRASRECIGVGDSSVIRYLADVTGHPLLSPDDATTLGIYMVTLANRYIDGCGFGVDVVTLSPRAPMAIFTESQVRKYSERFPQVEQQLEWELLEFYGKQMRKRGKGRI